MEILLALKAWKGWAYAGYALAMILKWIQDNKTEIEAIVLRVEKERASDNGLTNEELEQIVVDEFFKLIYPRITNVWLRVIPRIFIEKFVRSAVRQICKSSKKFKSGVQTHIELSSVK